jgi:hypothetical protein
MIPFEAKDGVKRANYFKSSFFYSYTFGLCFVVARVDFTWEKLLRADKFADEIRFNSLLTQFALNIEKWMKIHAKFNHIIAN